MNNHPNKISSERLMAHMRALCNEIGPRQATSEQERQAADYVETTLRGLGVTDIQRQLFKSQNSLGWNSIPSFAAGFLASGLAVLGNPWLKCLSSVLFFGSAYTFRQSILAAPTFFNELITRWTSQNVIAKIPAKDQARQTIYLIGHLDSQKQRFQFPPSQSKIMKAETSLPIVLGAIGGGLALGEALSKREKKSWWPWITGAVFLWGLSTALYDETQPHVEGANDNAAAVSVLLGMAEALTSQPLQHTDVILLFTGCEEVGCVGMERYLQQYAPPKENTFWVDIEMVGSDDLCYVTQHGISYLSTYAPHPEMVEIAERVAQQHPELGVKGKDMVIIEEIANLSRRDYKAVCVAGYDEKGVLPNWHRLSDNLDNIEAGTLSRAAAYTWELLQEIDQEA